MKKAEQILAWSGLVFFVLGVLLRIQHWPGAGISLSVAVFLLCLGYLPLQLILERRETSSRLKIIYLIFRFADLSMSRLLQVLSDPIREWQGKHEQTDDMVIIGIKI